MTLTLSDDRDESGVYLPIIAACIIAIMTTLGWAIDSANLFVANLTAQRAADVAAIAGAAKLALEGPDMPVPVVPASPPAFDATAKQAAEDIAYQNLLLGGVRAANVVSYPAKIDRIPGVGPTGRSRLVVTVDITVNTPLYVLRFVPGFGPTSVVKASSQAEVMPVIVSLILDNSGSMGCPNTAANCTCAPSCPAAPPRRIDRLVDAVNNFFLPRFDQTRDIISVTTFNRTASTIVPAVTTGGFNRAATQATVAGITPAGPTNFCDGQFTGFKGVEAAKGANPDLITAYVALSDGASTGMRVGFADPKPALPGNNPTSTVGYTYDYYIWDTEWRVAGNLDGSGNQIVNHAVSRMNPAIAPSGLSGSCNDGGCTTSPACSTLSYAGLSGAENGATELGQCLKTLKFQTPDGRVYPTRVAGVPSTFATIVNVNSWNWRFMDCAVALSDWMRGNRGVWYTIGLGGIDPSSNDAYQTPGDQTIRKDNLLSRIAFEYALPLLVVDFPGFRSYAELLVDVAQTRGEYFRTPSDTDLPKVFQAIAEQIKVRLIS